MFYLQLGGPIWSEPIHDQNFVDGLLEEVRKEPSSYQTSERIEGLLNVISEVY